MIDIGTHSTKLSNDAMSQSILSVESSASKARFLSEHFDNRIKASLRGLTEECSRNIHIPSFCAEAIYHDERLSPEIHYLHHKLQSSMRAQSALSARQTIEKLMDKSNEERHEQHFINVSSIGTTEWEVFSKQESARLSMLEQSKIDTLTSISRSDLETGKIHIHKALSVIKLIDPELHYEILEHISEAKLFHSTITQSFSDVITMGAIFIRPPSIKSDKLIYYFEQLIHEMSHLQLNCIFAIDRLILGDLFRREPSPLRVDRRPIFGVYHATYVSAKLCSALFRLYKRFKNDATLNTLVQCMDELLRGIDVLNRSLLTVAGRTLLKSMMRAATRVANDPLWDGFDFHASMRHRSTNRNFIPNRLIKFLQTSNFF